MKELLATCLFFVSLILTNGVVQKENVYQIFNEDSYVYKNCYIDHHAQKRCAIREEDKLEGNPYKTCYLDHEQYANTSLLSFAYKTVILSFTDGNDNKIVNVDLKNCSVKEVNLDIDIHKIRQIVFYDNKYNIIFYGHDVCKEFYCKAVYDSNGKIIRGVDPFFDIYVSSDISFKVASKGLLMNEYLSDGQVKLYFVPYEGFLKGVLEVLLLHSVPHGSWYGFSTREDRLGFCAFDDGKTVANSTKKIVCQQYDAEGKTKLMESEIPISKENHVESLKTTNYHKGLFLMANEWERKNDLSYKHTFLVYIDQYGKQGKHFIFDLNAKCEKLEVDQTFYTIRHIRNEHTVLFYNCYDPFKPLDRTIYTEHIPLDCFDYRKNLTGRESTTSYSAPSIASV